MLHLDNRAAEVYADMHADLEAERVGHPVPVHQPSASERESRLLRLQGFLRCYAKSIRYLLMERLGRAVHVQQQGC